MSVIKIFRAKTQPKDRFEVLVRPHIEGLYRFAYRLSQSQHDAEELVQQLLTKLYPKINQLEEIEKIRPWLSKALYNLYIDTFRKKQVESALFTDDSDSDENPTTDLSPHDIMSSEEMKKRLDGSIRCLSHDHRTVLMLHDAEGYTLTELEEILQTPIGTLKSRLSRARNNLKQALSMEPFGDEPRVNGIEERNS